ncbi:hypothetical protein CC80DRAFT_597512 [Byssothecium circinans]|uniref:XPA C-terminal domain-containing protein n=1 Tax=Byssothecium circinans TaxID=147558 RepID=A0A6A5TGT0_9PLEO|nr:hypothetical protein CC80DRAFT_597512 [Byssothecium circinans]
MADKKPASRKVKDDMTTLDSEKTLPTTRSTKVLSKGTKRERSPSASPTPDDASEPIIASPPAKKTKTRKASSKKSTDTAAKAAKAAKADEKKAEKERKANERKWKQDWKQWIESPANKTSATFQRDGADDDVINVKECLKVYNIKRDALSCLEHCPAPNPHAVAFTPMKLFKQADVQRLAFRKEAIMAGIPHEDDEELLSKGEELYEAKHGPVEDLYTAKLGGTKPAKDRAPEASNVSSYHWGLIRDLKAGHLLDDRALDALDELEDAGLRHMVDKDWKAED